MTIQQITLLAMAVLGGGFFVAGRLFAKKLSSGKSSFMPASIMTMRGAAAFFCVVVSWAGLLLAAVCVFILFS